MMHSFKLIVANQVAVVERILRVIRHRGFTLLSLELSTREEVLEINFTVQSSRKVELLINQLEKLYDIKNVKATSVKDL